MAPFVIGSLTYLYQAVDVIGPLDILSSGSKQLLQGLQTYNPDIDEATVAHAPEFVYYHIGLTLDPVQLTGGVQIVPNCTVYDCPGLDCLLLGGPDPDSFTLDPRFAEFIRRHVASKKLLFTNCTGSFVAASAGVLDGKRATINNLEYEWVKYRFPNVSWTKDTKWVVDGDIWTAAGAVAGMDMFSHWLKEKYGKEISTWSAAGLDFEPRDINGLPYQTTAR